MENNMVEFRSGEKRYRRLFQVSFVLFILTSAFLVSLCIIFAMQSNVYSFWHHNNNICTTKACIKAANVILENLDTTVDPCEDFHAFSCGSFVKSKRIPDELTRLDVFDILRTNLANDVADLLLQDVDEHDINATKNAKKLFKSCMNEELIELNGEDRFRQIIADELDGWPLIGQPSKSVNLLDKLIKARQMSFKTLIDIHVTLNPKDPQALILKVKQPSWLFNKQYYLDPKFVATYKDYMLKFALSLNSSLPTIRTDIDNMFELEKQISHEMSNEEQRRNTTHSNLTLAELINQVPLFDWHAYIVDGLFGNITNVTIGLNETIIIDDLPYIKFISGMFNSLKETNKRDLENLIIWSIFKSDISFLPKKFKDIKLDFDKMINIYTCGILFKVYKGTKSLLSRSVVCSNYVIDVMEYAVGRLYVATHFNNQSKQASTEMIENIRQEFIHILRESDWLDDESRELAIAKAENIDSKVGFPDFLYNDTYLNELYEDYSMDETEYLHNAFKILKLETNNAFSELRTRRDRKSWISGPAVVNAFYSPFSNQICFPAGILQSPFYDAESPNYLNYGGIGSVIGHEITHGFDDRGRMHDKEGVFYADGTHSLWTNRTVNNYKEKAKCIINQYNNFEVKQINKTLNGYLTQGENIADNGGLKESFKAYRNWVSKNGEESLLPGLNYNQNQLFFINYAQVWCTKYRSQSLLHRILSSNHSPGEFRIIGPTSNSPDFAREFNCKKGQRNNPVHKCSVW